MKVFAVTVLMVTLGASQALVDEKPKADPAFTYNPENICFKDCAYYKANGYCEADWSGCNSALVGKKVKDYCQASCAPVSDPCNPSPCKNGGQCYYGKCICSGACYGPTCETCVDPCSPNPCQNEGTCDNGVCTCTKGCTGKYCEEPDTSVVCTTLIVSNADYAGCNGKYVYMPSTKCGCNTCRPCYKLVTGTNERFLFASEENDGWRIGPSSDVCGNFHSWYPGTNVEPWEGSTGTEVRVTCG